MIQDATITKHVYRYVWVESCIKVEGGWRGNDVTKAKNENDPIWSWLCYINVFLDSFFVIFAWKLVNFFHSSSLYCNLSMYICKDLSILTSFSPFSMFSIWHFSKNPATIAYPDMYCITAILFIRIPILFSVLLLPCYKGLNSTCLFLMEVLNDRGSMCKFRNARSAFRNLHVDPLSLHTSMRKKQVEFTPYIYTLTKLYRFGYEISVCSYKTPGHYSTGIIIRCYTVSCHFMENWMSKFFLCLS